MRVRLLTAYFPPDIGSAAHLFYDIGRELVTAGHQVEVVTGFPSYHAKTYHAKKVKKRYGSYPVYRESLEGIEVIRVWSFHVGRDTPVGRAVWQIASALSFGLVGLGSSRPDLTLVYSPPLTLGLAAWLDRRLRGTRFVLNVQDLFPQSAIDLGILRNPVLVGIAEILERFLYREADFVTFHSRGNLEYALAKGARADQTAVIHNCVKTDELAPPSEPETLKAELGLEDCFVVSFAGVMGYSQDIDVILETAKDLEENEDIAFLLVGDGLEKERLVQRSDDLRLENVVWMPMQPREFYPRILHASDVCLTTLKGDVKTPVVPSKILSAMAAGRPVIAALDPKGDAPRLLDEARCGISVPPGERGRLTDAIMRLYEDPDLREKMGKAGRRYAEEHCSSQAVAREYLSIFERVLR